MSLWVKVKGPPCSICFLNNGITEPLEPNTLPKRVVMNLVLLSFCRQLIYISAKRLVAPITLVGFTALSVDINTNFLTLYREEISASILVPFTFILIDS